MAKAKETTKDSLMSRFRDMEIDLLKIPVLSRLLTWRGLQPALHLVTLAVFSLIIFTGILGTPVGSANFSIIFVWIFWFVLIIWFLIPLLGRFWCMVCPLPAPAEWLSRLTIYQKFHDRFSLGIKWPAKLDNLWLHNIIFIGVLFTSPILLTRSLVTGLLLAGTLAGPIVLDLVFTSRDGYTGRERPGRIWCRYVCPFTGFVGVYGLIAPFGMRVRDKEKCRRHKEGTPDCEAACPIHQDAQGYVNLVGDGEYEEAVEVILKDNPLPSVCGRVCFAPCEKECKRGEVDAPVSIRSLKRFAIDQVEDWALPKPDQEREEKVAIVGSGPAGLSCAYDLRKKGYQTTIYEALPVAGGMLAVGIPEYRLPREILQKDIQKLEEMGVEIKLNHRVGKEVKLADIKNEYQAVFIACGAHQARRMNLPGEDLPEVMLGIEFLREGNSKRALKLGEKVIVVGGGNSAIDAARMAKRVGAKDVTIAYRRSQVEMPAYQKDLEEALEEGINIEFLTNPTKILGDEQVEAVEFVRMELGQPDESGRRRPIPIEGSEFTLPCDNLIISIGQSPDTNSLTDDLNLETTNQGNLIVDEITLQTNIEGIFAGGDCVTGPDEVITAQAAGRKAAESIHRYINGLDMHQGRELEGSYKSDIEVNTAVPKKERVPTPKLELERREGFEEVNLGLAEEPANREGQRCLKCSNPTLKECVAGAGPGTPNSAQESRNPGYGCPWFCYPGDLDYNAYCGLCTECVKSCPLDNTTFRFKPFGFLQDVFKTGKHHLDEVFKAIILLTGAGFFTSIMLGWWPELKDIGNYITDLRVFHPDQFGLYLLMLLGTTLLIVPGLHLLFTAASKAAAGGKTDKSLKELFVHHGYALVPHGLIIWMAFCFSFAFISGSYILNVINDPFGWGWNLFGLKNLPWTPVLSGVIPVLQAIVLTGGLAVSIYVTYRISVQVYRTSKAALRATGVYTIFLLGITWSFLYLYVG